MKVVLAVLAALTLVAAPAAAQVRPSAPVALPADGMVDKPCTSQPAGLNFASEYVRQYDWAWECRYAEANKQTPQRPRAVFIGDSITEGWVGLAPTLFVSGAVARGISGQTSPQVLVRFYQDVVRLRPKVVHIMIGTNDLAGNTGPTSAEMYTNHVAAMVDIARSNGIAVVLGSVLPAAKFPWKPALAPARQVVALNAWLRDFAKTRGAVYADYYKALANPEGGINADLAPDGIHPNARGYALMDPVAKAAIAEAEKLGMAKKP
ncbi:lysophospholipase L1-like esterase [Novosphingobium hassiacum]|uniref:Lysophospholipase L1-like esterase n=1 Tax=Novosphingobium hassiacum TaxID=173676 RepID=A0A7W6EXL2_9SPHN|nr:GDSL-type esterase/lipase family protein [Novosphingobium hassiacum]MBB3861964.1 lysophospholipase L1-like esterase [Novosphingobium hassiacum]